MRPITEISEQSKNFFIENVKTFSPKEHEIIFALIRSYQIEYGDVVLGILPYNAKHQKKGIKFDFDNLPLKLQWILIEFINTHIKSR